jgi:ADP-L-glycero-D-manno-heptose 6-epimerase
MMNASPSATAGSKLPSGLLSGVLKDVWPRSRVLVTGGAGFIGSALIWELNRRGCDNVVIADSISQSERQRNLRPLRFSGYLDPQAALAGLRSRSLGNFDFIFHLGACSSTTETNADFLRRNNFDYSADLAAWAVSAGVRFLYASSAATYGDGSAGMDDTDLENLDRLRPLNLYAHFKQQMDLHAWRHGWLDHIVALKYFNVFGPNEEHKGEMRSVVRKGFAQVADTGVLSLFKSYRPECRDGEQRRDFLYVKDAVDMTLYLAAAPSAAGIFNLGSGETHTWNDLARALFLALGREPRIEYVDMPAAIRDKYQYFTQANIAKLRAVGYARPITPLGDAVRDYVASYLLPGKSLGEEAALSA